MNTQPEYIKIKSLISQTQLCVNDMLELLAQEREHLLHNRSQELLQVVEEKSAILSRINELDNERKKLVTEQIASKQSEFIPWLDSLDPTKELSRLWDTLSGDLKQCKMNNASNGIISEKMAANTSQLLGMLTGTSKAENTRLYSADGSTSGSLNTIHDTTA